MEQQRANVSTPARLYRFDLIQHCPLLPYAERDAFSLRSATTTNRSPLRVRGEKRNFLAFTIVCQSVPCKEMYWA